MKSKHSLRSTAPRARACTGMSSLAALIDTISSENAEQHARIRHLEATIAKQAAAEMANERTIRALEAAKSAALVTFLSRHHAETQLRVEHDHCKTHVEAAWQRIRELQARKADVVQQMHDISVADAQAAERREHKRKAAAFAEMVVHTPASVLQHEVCELVARLRAEDEARERWETEVREAERVASEAAEAARLAEDQLAAQAAAEEEEAAAEQERIAAEHEAAERAAAQEVASARAAKQAECLTSAVLQAISRGRSTSTSALWLRLQELSSERVGPIDGERVERALEELRASFLIFEPQPGIFGAL